MQTLFLSRFHVYVYLCMFHVYICYITLLSTATFSVFNSVLAYFTFGTFFVFEFYEFLLYSRKSELIPWKMWSSRGSPSAGRLQIINWDFLNSDLQETYFHALYSLALLLLWGIVLINIILIFFLDSFLILYLPVLF